jgi:hypothetical protein
VIDNYLPQEEFEIIKNKIMGKDFPWFYNSYVAFEDEINDKTMYFTHVFYNYSQVNSNFFELIRPLISKLKR